MEFWNLVFMQNERGPVDRPGQVRLPDPRRAAGQEHRHRHGHGAHGRPAAGRRQPVRDRPDAPGPRPGGRAGRQDLRRALRARGQPVASRRRPAARGGRPRPHRAHAHRRRRHAVERGPRLRAAPHRAPRGALDAPARRAGAGAARSCCRSRATAWRRPTPSSPPTSSASRPTPTPRRTRSCRPCGPARRSSTSPSPTRKQSGGAAAVRRQGVPAARHLRLPDRPHPRDGGRAGHQRRRDRASAG